VIEVLGGIEPARTLVLTALAKGIPVVTANKSLLALHGDELFSTAARWAQRQKHRCG
jgi:homoserine dehydrogenase